MVQAEALAAPGAVLDDVTLLELFPVALRCSGCTRLIARAERVPCGPLRLRCRRCGIFNVFGMLDNEG